MRFPWHRYGHPEDGDFSGNRGASVSPCPSPGESERSPVAAHHSPGQPDPPAGPQSQAPEPFGGRYQILRPLGESGCKRTYLARDLLLDRDVVVEAVREPELGRAELPELATRVRAAGRLAHPGVACVLDLGERSGRPYVVTQYVPGGSLKDLLNRSVGGRLPIPHALRIAEQLCATLAYLHSHAMVHRNLKPANILLAEDGSVMLTGFGFGLGLAVEVSRVSGTSVAAGDLSYTAPEQLSGQVDSRTDLYALGAVLYEMIRGQPPFVGNDCGAIAIQHLHRKPAPLSNRVANLPPGLEGLILRLLRKPPAGRPSSADAVHSQIRAIGARLVAQPVCGSSSAEVGLPAGIRSARGATFRLRKPQLVAMAGAAAVVLSLTLTSVYRRPIPKRQLEALACHPIKVDESVKLPRGWNSDAQMATAGTYVSGEGKSNGDGETVRRLRETAAAGDAIAQTELGYRYATGEGVTQDDNQALRWFREAAENGNADAEYNLAMTYRDGRGIPSDRTEALRWLHKAAAQGSAEAQYVLGSAYLTGEDVAHDDQQALYWLRQAAAQGNVRAENALGVMYEQGRGVVRNYTEALEWYRKAAASGDAKAQLNLGIMYENGKGVAPDYVQALQWYTRAAAQGDAYAETSLGVMYSRGIGVAKDFAKALDWFRRAAALDEPKAQFNLGVMYDNGLGVERNYAEAARWYSEAAKRGHVDAQFNLAYMYEHGQGVTRSYPDAVQWYRKAAAQGDDDATRKLRAMGSVGVAGQNPNRREETGVSSPPRLRSLEY